MANTINTAAENKKTIVAEVVRFGEKITIPTGITIPEAIIVLQEKEKEEETVVLLKEQFDVFIWDGAYALANALDNKFGWFKQMTTPGNFFRPDEPPQLRSVNCGPRETVQVPWGRFTVPGIEGDGFLQTNAFESSTGMYCFELIAKIKRKHTGLFKELCAEIRRQIAAISLYRGKVITIRFHDESGCRIDNPEPTFGDIQGIDAGQIIFSRHIEAALEANLYTPLKKTARVRAAGIPLKRGILLAGPYGTGKTLIGAFTADLATRNGWTFLSCQGAIDFSACVRFAKRYQPAVVYCEDIDRVTCGDRDTQLDEILETIDGVDAKGSEIMLVLTTNEVETIHQGMLRPGRLDAVIAIERPDAEAVERLICRYAGKLLRSGETLAAVGELLAGSTPAVIREVVERAKLTSLAGDDCEELQLTERGLVVAAQTMKTQLELLNRETHKDQDPMAVFGAVLAQHLIEGAKAAADAAPGIRKMLAEPTRPNGHVNA